MFFMWKLFAIWIFFFFHSWENYAVSEFEPHVLINLRKNHFWGRFQASYSNRKHKLVKILKYFLMKFVVCTFNLPKHNSRKSWACMKNYLKKFAFFATFTIEPQNFHRLQTKWWNSADIITDLGQNFNSIMKASINWMSHEKNLQQTPKNQFFVHYNKKTL